MAEAGSRQRQCDHSVRGGEAGGSIQPEPCCGAIPSGRGFLAALERFEGERGVIRQRIRCGQWLTA